MTLCRLAICLCLAVSSTGELSAADVPVDHAAKMARGLRLFDERVERLLTTKCLACHNARTQEGAFVLTTREQLLKGGERGPAILPGRGNDSLLLKLVRRAHEPFMPAEAEPLTNEECQTLADWIDCGAPYRESLSIDETPLEDWTRRTIDESARQFWSFQPLQQIAVPATLDSPSAPVARVDHPLDAFLCSAQHAQGLQPTPRAPRRTQIRRLTLDLLGVPPTPDEVRDFVADDAPEAYERLVDRLLADPRHGERMARYWLDIARFAESHGFEHDYDRPSAFHYRDFVVQAINENLPFDDFVRWQIAGDELAPDQRLALMATGFLAAGVHSTQITKNEVERHRYDELDDMVGTMGTAMLGLTVGCARCHDHKYDPIPQADYYRLLAAFTNTVRSEVELDFDPEGHAAALAVFEAAHAPHAAAVARYEREVLPEKLREWLAGAEAQALRPQWLAPLSVQVTSEAGARFVAQPDGSWLATGPSGDHDVYTVKLRSRLPEVAAIRVEGLSDLSLRNGGPGRADNGNFALSTITASGSLAPLASNADTAPTSNLPPDSAKTQTIPFSTARATFEQLGLPVAAALDDNPASAWAIDPQFGRHHAAVFDLRQPWLTPAGQESELTIRLHFECNTRHSLGRIRIALSADSEIPAENSEPFAEEVLSILKAAPTDWSAAQTERLLEWYRGRDSGWRKLEERRLAHAATKPLPRQQKVLVATEGLPAITLHTQAAREYLDATHFLKRGDPDHKERVADLGVLQVLSHDRGAATPWKSQTNPNSRTSQQRRAVALWLTDVEAGAGALLARVAVNRLWQQHFGQGLVSTPSDFGQRGEPPSHPELLEWLAAELVESGWDVKRLRRLIVTSDAYRQSAANDDALVAADPANRWLARWRPRRLEAEAIRDSLLAVTGLLDDRMAGAGTLDATQTRRSLYFMIKRSQLIPMLTVFDAPDGTTGVAVRPQTVVAPQALWMLNDPLMQRAAGQLARQIEASASEPSEQVRQVYQRVLQRDPTPRELQLGRDFLSPQSSTTDLQLLCQCVLCLNEFVTLE